MGGLGEGLQCVGLVDAGQRVLCEVPAARDVLVLQALLVVAADRRHFRRELALGHEHRFPGLVGGDLAHAGGGLHEAVFVRLDPPGVPELLVDVLVGRKLCLVGELLPHQ